MILLKSILLGLSVAAPVGPIGLLTIQRSLTHGRKAGFYTGMGAATADMTYAVVAAFGLVAITVALEDKASILQVIGGVFLFYLGVMSIRKTQVGAAAQSYAVNLWKMYITTFLLTIASPFTAMTFLAMFAGLGVQSTDWTTSIQLALGVFIGSGLWWLFLSWAISKLRGAISDNFVLWINRGSGILMIGLALFSFTMLFIK